ncbi:MAG TPA: hypothetical protein VFB93_07955 [Burkholderiales bacterium]|nr:hypothetical protein [Burkholderiales bacterium]
MLGFLDHRLAAHAARLHAFLHAVIQVGEAGRLVRHEAAQHIGVVEDRDVLYHFGVELQLAQAVRGRNTGDDEIEGLLRLAVGRLSICNDCLS